MEEIELQKLTFFTEGNTYTGSKTKDPAAGVMLRYLVRPEKESGSLSVFFWKEDLCFEKAKDKQNAEFSMDEEGLSKAKAWLQAEYEKL